MEAPTVIPRGSGEVVGSSPERRVEILSDHPALHATWSRFAPGRAGADLHVHRRHGDSFYVLAGELTLRLGPDGAPVVVPAGTLAHVPALVVHGFLNAGHDHLEFLNLHAPGQGFAGYLRALRDDRAGAYDQEPPPDGGGRPATLARIGERAVAADEPGRREALLLATDDLVVRETWHDAAGPPTPDEPGGDGAALYVLEGELAVGPGPGAPRAGAGSWVELPPGAPTVAPAGSQPVRYLAIKPP
jgi:quercetin dioxygenase-like cupin family protein